jgi:dihydrofolate synthase / folylpolyglutamate synthase
MDKQEIIEFLNNLQKRKYNLDLGAINEILAKLGEPHKNLKVIHVAGTNGKGSVCAILSSILKSAGHKVGMYTSPHLKRINERFLINGEEISDEDFVRCFNIVNEQYSNQTYFEMMTALAFVYFSEKKLDYVILEVGLGGRLDATNVVDPLVSVITNISLEHQEYLGETILEIAGEKAGIIKNGKTVVTACLGDALEVIKKVAEKKKASIVMVEKIEQDNGFFSINGHKQLEMNLKGEFQKINAATAVTVIDIIGGITEDAIKKGLANAIWHGRFEFVSDNVLVDCAHNADGSKVLAKEVKKLGKKVVSVVGILDDKDKETMVKEFCSFSEHVIFCKPDNSRAADPNELVDYCGCSKEIIEDVKQAVLKAKELNYELVVVCGSIYTVGEVLIK